MQLFQKIFPTIVPPYHVSLSSSYVVCLDHTVVTRPTRRTSCRLHENMSFLLSSVRVMPLTSHFVQLSHKVYFSCTQTQQQERNWKTNKAFSPKTRSEMCFEKCSIEKENLLAVEKFSVTAKKIEWAWSWNFSITPLFRPLVSLIVPRNFNKASDELDVCLQFTALEVFHQTAFRRARRMETEDNYSQCVFASHLSVMLTSFPSIIHEGIFLFR